MILLLIKLSIYLSRPSQACSVKMLCGDVTNGTRAMARHTDFGQCIEVNGLT